MNRARLALLSSALLLFAGCVPGSGSNLLVRADPPSCLPQVARVLRAEGFDVSEGTVASKYKLSFEGAPSSSVFGQVYETPPFGIRIFFGERSFEFSKTALEQRQRIINRIAPICGPVTVQQV